MIKKIMWVVLIGALGFTLVKETWEYSYNKEYTEATLTKIKEYNFVTEIQINHLIMVVDSLNQEVGRLKRRNEI